MVATNKITIDFEALAKEVYHGTVTPWVLPHPLYYQTADIIKSPVYKAFGGSLKHQKFNSPDYNLLKELRANIYIFSAAKTFQQVKSVSQELTEGNKIRPFREFRAKAIQVFGMYNEQYLQAEWQTAGMSAINAVKWNKIESQKETFPYLRYSDVDDAHECAICGAMHGIIARVDDPFWDRFMPPNHFCCRCIAEQLEDGETSGNLDEIGEATKERMQPEFLMNPGKDKVIFKDEGKNKHPYFDVDEKYSKLAASNFNLNIPDAESD